MYDVASIQQRILEFLKTLFAIFHLHIDTFTPAALQFKKNIILQSGTKHPALYAAKIQCTTSRKQPSNWGTTRILLTNSNL